MKCVRIIVTCVVTTDEGKEMLAGWLLVVLGPYLSKAQYLKCLSLIVPHPPQPYGMG